MKIRKATDAMRKSEPDSVLLMIARVVVTVFFALNLLSIPVELISGDELPARAPAHGLAYLMLALLPWFPGPALIGCGITLLILPLLPTGSAADLMLLPVGMAAAAITGSGLRRVYIASGVAVTYMVMTVYLHPSRTANSEPWGWLCLAVLGLAFGLVVKFFVRSRSQGIQQIQDLKQQQERIRSDERAALARELHDVVAHQLSLITLQAMAVSGSDDINELHEGFERVGSAASRALVELRSLLTVLRRTEDETQPIDTIEAPKTPTAVAEEMRSILEEHGFAAQIYVSPTSENLEVPLRRTIGRFFQETTTNMIRHARPGSACLLECRISPDSVILRAENQINHQSSLLGHLSTGWGIRGLEERISLSKGRFKAGAQGELWVVTAEIPIEEGSVRLAPEVAYEDR